MSQALQILRCDRKWIHLLHMTPFHFVYIFTHRCTTVITSDLWLWFLLCLLLGKSWLRLGVATRSNHFEILWWHNQAEPSPEELAKWQRLLWEIRNWKILMQWGKLFPRAKALIIKPGQIIFSLLTNLTLVYTLHEINCPVRYFVREKFPYLCDFSQKSCCTPKYFF